MLFQSSKSLVVVDADGWLFARVRGLDLHVALWRLTNVPPDLALDDESVVLVAKDTDAANDVAPRFARRFATVIVTREPKPNEALEAIAVGAFGYVDANASDELLRRTFIGVLNGEAAYGRLLLGAWLRRSTGVEGRSGPALAADRLTPRQRQIVDLIAAGATDREIAVALGIRTATAQKHVANVLRRLGARNRAAVVGMLFTEPSLS